jgi:hypothetical protein
MMTIYWKGATYTATTESDMLRLLLVLRLLGVRA